jgi:O-antigen/teichoic acid export membrane protein
MNDFIKHFSRQLNRLRLVLSEEAATVTFSLTFQQVANFVTTLITARFLGASVFGQVALIKTTLGVCATFGPLGLNIGLMKYLASKDDDPETRWRSFNLFRTMVATANLLLPGLLVAIGYSLSSGDNEAQTYWLLLATAFLGLPFMSDIALFGAYYRVVGRISRFSILTMVFQSLLAGSGAIIVSMIYPRPILIIAVAILSPAVVTLILVLLGNPEKMASSSRSVSYKAQDYRPLIPVLGQSLWMASSVFVYSMLRNMDIVMLGNYAAPNELASYSLLSTLAYAIFIVPLALSQGLGPAVARAKEVNNTAVLESIFAKYFDKACLVSGFLAAGTAAFGDRLSLVVGPSFELSTTIAILLAMAQLSSAILGPTGFALSMTGHHRSEFYLLCIATVSMFLLLRWLVPAYGASGAAIASLAVYVVANSLRLILVRTYIGVWLTRWRDLYFPITGLGIALAMRWLAWQSGDGLLVNIAAVVAFSCVYGVAFLIQRKFFLRNIGDQPA